MEKIGISGAIAKAFIRSRLTPLIVVSALLLGVFAVSVTPREEEPQIVVPMVDVMVSYPGASAGEVESIVTWPMEQLLYEISGVEYVYSMTRPGVSLAIVRFYVGSDVEDSLVKLYNKLSSNYDRIPPGVSKPLIKLRSIDEVPILTLTLSSDSASSSDIRRVAEEVAIELKKDQSVAELTITGGERRQVRVILDTMKLSSRGLSPMSIIRLLKLENVSLVSGSFQSAGREVIVDTGRFVKNVDDVKNLAVGVQVGTVIYLKDVADVVDGPGEPSNYVLMGHGRGGPDKESTKNESIKTEGTTTGNTNHTIQPALAQQSAVTIAVAKKKGSNATTVAQHAIKKIEDIRGWILPSNINVTVTRNYGETAKEKSNELLDHLMIATFSVIILVAIALGIKESIVVAVAVPVTLALTLLINYLYGYTLNRVTLFALIFSIGILVDDAIVVVENIHRHFVMSGVSVKNAVRAVDEVGNPTILATVTVIAALLPMAFVTGLMGPYMRPIPVGASAAMLFSLLIALIVTPWMSFIVLRKVKHSHSGNEAQEGKLLRVFYEKIMNPLLKSRKLRVVTFGIVATLLLLSLVLLPLKLVTVKMLPFDNKSEIQVIVDMPEGTTLEETLSVTRELAGKLKDMPEVQDYQVYVGTAAPFNFNGLVRHYFLRREPNMADIQVNLVDKHRRHEQSHEIAKRMRGPLQEIGEKRGANVKIAEIPPGPPVLSTLVAEVYGPETVGQVKVADNIKTALMQTDGVVDVDWLYEADQDKYIFEVDTAKAASNGVTTEAIASTIAVALGGMPVGLVHTQSDKSPLEIVLRLPVEKRSDILKLEGVQVPDASGRLITVGELVTIKKTTYDKTIFHKNLRRVIYVTGDVAGSQESPAYAILKLKDRIASIMAPDGQKIRQYFSAQPALEKTYSMKWDGEWQITYEVFRDMGIAFAVVLILIYVLVVGWFKNFLTPLIIMLPIPLTLVGILPGHWAMGAFFTATSMIGFIALAGIIVRNSILLVDFIQMDWNETGNLGDAILKAGAVRFRPIALTAAAVLVGSLVMLFDPIFQGLAISMMFGALSATLLTLIAVPLLYYEFYRKRPCPINIDECPVPTEVTK